MKALPLTLEEQAVGGIRCDGETLRIRFSPRERAIDVATYAAVEGTFIVGFAVVGGWEVLGLVVVAGVRLLGGIAGVTSVVRAGRDSVVVRNGWRRQVVPVGSIRRVVVMETEDEDDDLASWWMGWWNRRFAAPELALDDGRRVRCQAMASRRRRRGAVQPVPAEHKAAVLRRWLDLPPE